MKLSDICIKRPVFASVLSLILIVFGLIGYVHLETRYFPKIHQPTATVSVRLDGASPSLMKNQVTRILENTLVNLDNLAEMQSDSMYGRSNVYLRFDDGTDMVKAMGDVRDRVSGVRDQLPTDIYAPSVSTGGVSRPVLNIGFMDPDLTSSQIRDYVIKVVEPQITNLPGVGGVWSYGASTYALRVWLDPQKMAALGVTVTDVKNTLQNNNLDFSGGAIRGSDRSYTLVADTRLHSVKQFANLIIRDTKGQMVKLKDIATVELGSSSLEMSPMRINGKNAIDMEIRPLDTANPITVSKEAKKVLATIKVKLPRGMVMKTTYDQSLFLKSSINESFMTLIEAVLLVMLVVFLFLGSLRAALIPIITIPVCVIGVFGAMLAFGFTINILTLLAIIMAIGLVVDDAIVMLENIHRHVEDGVKPLAAAFLGSKEIGFSVIAMTLTLAAAYAPTGFMTGFTATVFREFAFTLAGAVLISGFVALTLSPMMCGYVLKSNQRQNKFEKYIQAIFKKSNAVYSKMLDTILHKRFWVVGAICVIAVLGYFVFVFVPQSFIPKEDIGYFTVGISSPPGSTIKYTNSYMRQLERIYAKSPQILSYASFINAGGATNFVTMKPWDQRDTSTDDVLKKIVPKMKDIPGILVDADVPDPVDYGNGSGGKAILIHMMTLGTYFDLQKSMDKIVKVLKIYPGTTDVISDLKFDNQVFNVDFKRSQAASLGVNLQDVADTISTMVSGKHITDVQMGAQSYDVLVQMQMQDLKSFAGLSNIYVRSAKSDMVPISNLVDLSKAVRQTKMFRYNRMNAAAITAQLSPGYSLGEVVHHIQQVLNQNLSSNERYAFAGRAQAFLDSNGEMFWLFLLSIVFIYLVLSAQFESFVDPFVILLSVPLCMVGALLTLWVTGGTLNLYTNIGLITLVGLITKHGILITQFANTRLQEGDSLFDAVRHAAVIRLRPILMTTFAMVLGALPLALATGPGSTCRSQIGWVIVGGMIFGTFFSLVVVPVAFTFLAPLDHRKKEILKLRP